MSSLPLIRHTVDEYLAMDEGSEKRLEFVDGEVLAMAGGTERHSLLGAKAIVALTLALARSPCRVHSSDQRVHVVATGGFFYPDVVVACEPRVPGPPRTITNPSLVVEVLSPTTATFDRGAKLGHYQQIPTLTDVLFVESWRIRVDHFRRVAQNVWEQTIYLSVEESIRLAVHDAEVRMADLYAQFDFFADEPEDAAGAT